MPVDEVLPSIHDVAGQIEADTVVSELALISKDTIKAAPRVRAPVATCFGQRDCDKFQDDILLFTTAGGPQPRNAALDGEDRKGHAVMAGHRDCGQSIAYRSAKPSPKLKRCLPSRGGRS